ncbi:hypothetical protein PENSPDRAFT_618743 [Peniophora sp. CONT]|nr:hypothetical protein PENSPDRAFT_618743 [Peniophora sp. CONT]
MGIVVSIMLYIFNGTADPEFLLRLGIGSDARFKHTDNLVYLHRSVAAFKRSSELTPEDHPEWPERQICYASSLLKRFERVDDLVDLDNAILVLCSITESSLHGDVNKSARLCAYGALLMTRFERTGKREDVEDIISSQRHALALMRDDDPDRESCLHVLIEALMVRFNRLDKLEDIKAAISAQRLAVDLISDNHLEDTAYLFYINVLSLARFHRLGTLGDVDDLIMSQRRAVRLAPEGHAFTPFYLCKLGVLLRLRFLRKDDVADITESITVHRRALGIVLPSDLSFPLFQFELANALQCRFERLGDFEDIMDSVAAYRCAIELAPSNCPAKLAMLTNLGVSLSRRFQVIGTLEDLDDAIQAYRDAIHLRGGHPELCVEQFTDIGIAFRDRFEHTGNIDDIEGSIAALRLAVDEMPLDYADRPVVLSNLGHSLQVRYNRFGERGDRDSAIMAQRRAEAFLTDHHHPSPVILMNLGRALLNYFDIDGDPDTLTTSLSMFCRAIYLTADCQPMIPRLYCAYGSALSTLFIRTGDFEDIDNAVKAYENATDLVPDNHPDEPSCFSGLADALLLRFQRGHELRDVLRAVASYSRAIELTPAGHPGEPYLYEHLGAALCHQVQSQSHFEEAVRSLTCVVTCSQAGLHTRQNAGMLCLRMMDLHPQLGSKDDLLLAHASVMELLLEFVSVGLTIDRRYDEAAVKAPVVHAAVSCAIRFAELPQAVEWLEAGRSIVWSQLLDMRTSLDELEVHHPSLAEELRDVQSQLRKSEHTSSAVLPKDRMLLIKANMDADHRRRLAIRYKQLIAQVRSCAGFETFFQSKKLPALVIPSELCSGPVVVINAYFTRCDALIILGDGTIRHVALPNLSLDKVTKLHSMWNECLIEAHVSERGSISRAGSRRDIIRRVTRLLECIWTWIVHPILQVINQASCPPHNGSLTHVTWCPTGSLVQLPLHAAGIYSDPSGPRVYDCVVSSYTPSLSALRRAVDGISSQRCLPPKALIVTQPQTPGYPPLPGTLAEREHIEQILREGQISSRSYNHEDATVADILGVVDQYPWVHLSCHGAQHNEDATQSAFALYDGPLSLSKLMSVTADNAELAFLSACQTATGDKINTDESAHLAAGMLAVGFKGVVATNWAIRDEDAPIIGQAYYRKLLELRSTGAIGKGQTGAALALHEAARILREKVGEDQVLRWAPFVHFGA